MTPQSQSERDAFEADGFRTEAACQFGFQTTNDDCTEYRCTQEALIAFAKACERKGLADARELARGIHGLVDDLDERIAAIDAEITPVRVAEEARFMTAQGYVRATDDQPGARWIKPEPEYHECPCGAGENPCPREDGKPLCAESTS